VQRGLDECDTESVRSRVLRIDHGADDVDMLWPMQHWILVQRGLDECDAKSVRSRVLRIDHGTNGVNMHWPLQRWVLVWRWLDECDAKYMPNRLLLPSRIWCSDSLLRRIRVSNDWAICRWYLRGNEECVSNCVKISDCHSLSLSFHVYFQKLDIKHVRNSVIDCCSFSISVCISVEKPDIKHVRN
jgi:hypothetical protein